MADPVIGHGRGAPGTGTSLNALPDVPQTSVDVIRVYHSPVDGLMHVRWPDGLDVSVPDLRAAWNLAQERR